MGEFKVDVVKRGDADCDEVTVCVFSIDALTLGDGDVDAVCAFTVELTRAVFDLIAVDVSERVAADDKDALPERLAVPEPLPEDVGVPPRRDEDDDGELVGVACELLVADEILVEDSEEVEIAVPCAEKEGVVVKEAVMEASEL